MPESRAVHAARATTVLFIGGAERSGSTLLDRLLGQLPRHVSVGEIVHLWTRGVQGDERCGCGQSFHRCPFWTRVGEVAFGGWDRLDVDAVLALQRRVDRTRFIPLMVASIRSPYTRRRRAYARILERLYAAVAQVADADVVVDSSKHASTAFLLRDVPNVSTRVVHLVRDSRGVAFSMQKRVRRPEVTDRDALMHRQGAARAGITWLLVNGLFDALRLSGGSVRRIRYEDLVADPGEVATRLRTDVRALDADLAFVDGGTIHLGVDHTVAGNPMRFKHGDLTVRADEEWRSAMASPTRRVVTALTAPLLRRYGYRLKGAR